MLIEHQMVDLKNMVSHFFINKGILTSKSILVQHSPDFWV